MYPPPPFFYFYFFKITDWFTVSICPSCLFCFVEHVTHTAWWVWRLCWVYRVFQFSENQNNKLCQNQFVDLWFMITNLRFCFGLRCESWPWLKTSYLSVFYAWTTQFGLKEPSSARLCHSRVVFLDRGPDWTVILAGVSPLLGQNLPVCLGWALCLYSFLQENKGGADLSFWMKVAENSFSSPRISRFQPKYWWKSAQDAVLNNIQALWVYTLHEMAAYAKALPLNLKICRLHLDLLGVN